MENISREEEIKKAAEECVDVLTSWDAVAFTEGAEWADANPCYDKVIKMIQEESRKIDEFAKTHPKSESYMDGYHNALVAIKDKLHWEEYKRKNKISDDNE